MKKGFLAGVLLFFMYFMYVGACYAIPNHFMPVGSPQEALTVKASQGGLQSGWYFGVFDWQGNMSDGLLLLGKNKENEIITSAQFKVIKKQGGSGYQISVIEGVDIGSTLDIGNSEDFSFFFYDGTNYYEPDNIIKDINNEYSYYFSNKNQKTGTVKGNDISAVPTPQSFILLLSGVLGLVGLTRRGQLTK